MTLSWCLIRGMESDKRSSLFYLLLKWASCSLGQPTFSSAAEQKRIMVACSDPSTAIMNFIARSPLGAGESMDFKLWSYLFSLRTSYFVDVSLSLK